MKYYILLITILFLFSCGNEKVLQLPEISHSEISEIKDVSPAYLFYDETKIDSVELNRKNLISSTNWLINVDKRLTLKQAIPHIKYLQEKKANSSHKKEGTKNYFTCNDISRKNLGFVEFTDVVYHEELVNTYLSKTRIEEHQYLILFEQNNKVLLNSEKISIEELEEFIVKHGQYTIKLPNVFYLNFNSNLTFKDYINYKSLLSSLNSGHVEISNHEFISN